MIAVDPHRCAIAVQTSATMERCVQQCFAVFVLNSHHYILPRSQQYGMIPILYVGLWHFIELKLASNGTWLTTIKLKLAIYFFVQK